MEIIYKNRQFCCNSSVSEDEFVREWVNNETNDKILKLETYPIIPDLFYTEFNETHFQWCGPLLMIAQAFAGISKTKFVFYLSSYIFKLLSFLMIARLRLVKFKTPENIYAKVHEEGTDILQDIGLATLTASDFYENVVKNGVIDVIRVSTVLSFTTFDGYLAITKKGWFRYFSLIIQ